MLQIISNWRGQGNDQNKVLDLNATDAFIVKWYPFSALETIQDAWGALAENSMEPNVFFTPWFAKPAHHHIQSCSGAITVWRRHQAGGDKLTALLAGRVTRSRFGIPMFEAWTHPFAPCGRPLILREQFNDSVRCLLASLNQLPGRPQALIIRHMSLSSSIGSALTQLLTMDGEKWRVFSPYKRDILYRPNSIDRSRREENIASQYGFVITKSRRATLDRKMRRLQEMGEVRFTKSQSLEHLKQDLSYFTKLEAQGWKGRAGTSIQQNDDANALLSKLAERAENGQVVCYTMWLDNKPLNSIIVLVQGAYQWVWKTAYDEYYNWAYPGIQGIVHLSLECIHDNKLQMADSCLIHDARIPQNLWREHMRMGELFVCRSGLSKRQISFLYKVEGLYRLIYRQLRTLKHKVVQMRQRYHPYHLEMPTKRDV